LESAKSQSEGGNCVMSIKKKNVGLRAALIVLALLTAWLTFTQSAACGKALKEALRLCGGSLLLSLFPFLIVSSLLVQCGALEVAGILLTPIARLMGFRAGCSGGILLMGLLGGFAPAANAVREAYHAQKLDSIQAAFLLPACIESGPSFVILAVGGNMLGSTKLGVRLFIAQVLAGWISAGVLYRVARKKHLKKSPVAVAKISSKEHGNTTLHDTQEPSTPKLDRIIADAAMTYVRLCGFILYFRFLAGGLGAFLPQKLRVYPAMLLEVCSGCDLAVKSGRYAAFLCCAALSLQGLSALMQVRTICPQEISFAPLLAARALHLPLSLGLFWLLLPRGESEVYSSLPARVITMQRVPTDCALLVFFACCVLACELCRWLPQKEQ
jgi:hypothetical protein